MRPCAMQCAFETMFTVVNSMPNYSIVQGIGSYFLLEERFAKRLSRKMLQYVFRQLGNAYVIDVVGDF